MKKPDFRKLDIRQNRKLRGLSDRVYSRVGDNIYLIMLIMAILFVFSGLLVGLLGRGWLAAWFFVLLGLLMGFFPCLKYVMDMPVDEEEDEEPEAGEEPGPEPVIPPGSSDQGDRRYAGGDRSAADERNAGGERSADDDRRAGNDRSAGDRAAFDADDAEAQRWAVEIEAMLARDRQKREAGRWQREAEMRREEERILEEARRREREKLMEEERRKEEKEKARRRQNEESRAKWDSARAKGSRKNIYRPENFTSKGVGYFDGIRSSQELKKKYKELVKAHHPDNGGTPEMMIEIQKQYRELELFFRSYEKHNRS